MILQSFHRAEVAKIWRNKGGKMAGKWQNMTAKPLQVAEKWRLVQQSGQPMTLAPRAGRQIVCKGTITTRQIPARLALLQEPHAGQVRIKTASSLTRFFQSITGSALHPPFPLPRGRKHFFQRRRLHWVEQASQRAVRIRCFRAMSMGVRSVVTLRRRSWSHIRYA